MKRFTETEKWRDPWFQKLDKESRTLWLWVCDRVDNAGVIDICWPICNAETMGSFNEESMNSFGDRVEKLDNGKWWLPKFIEFQVGKLSNHCKPHIYIINILEKHNLSHRVCLKVCSTFKEKDKEKDKDKEQEKDKEKKERAINVLNYLNDKTGKKFQQVDGSLKFIIARIKEGATEEQCRAVIDLKCSSWLRDPKMSSYLRPQTLFNGEKFAAYVGELNSIPVSQSRPSYSDLKTNGAI